MDNIGRAFTFMFEDKAWPGKFVLGAVFALLSCVVIGIPFLLGYLLELTRNAYENKEIPLPEWDNLTEKLNKGLMFFIVLIIYSIPGLLFYNLPCLGACIGGIYGIAVALIIPYLMANFALTNDFKAAFDFQKIIDFTKDNISDVLVVVLLSLGMQIIASLGLIILVIGWFFTVFWAALGKAYLIGKLYRYVQSKQIEIPV
ncbi:MAG: DUF4013 domain-containing protein [candidate division Zixibacteria bacterium]|nr:DUF4013 domain-containing protein [candidate division Zixibacteria bacterium]